MSLERARPWLDDMPDAINWVGRLTAGKTIIDYRADRPMRDAVERNLERLSEASRHLPPELTAAHPELPWRQIAQVGNILRHAYRWVDHAMVWEIVARASAPPLTLTGSSQDQGAYRNVHLCHTAFAKAGNNLPELDAPSTKAPLASSGVQTTGLAPIDVVQSVPAMRKRILALAKIP